MQISILIGALIIQLGAEKEIKNQVLESSFRGVR